MANVFYSRFAVEGLGFRALTSAMPIDNVPLGDMDPAKNPGTQS